MVALVKNLPDGFLAELLSPEDGLSPFREVGELALAALSMCLRGSKHILAPVRVANDYLPMLIARIEHTRCLS